MIRIQSDSPKAIRAMQRIKDAATPENLDRVVEKAAMQTHAAIVKATPKKWFGQVRAGWAVEKPGDGTRLVVNRNKIMFFLEHGTQAHGPKNAKALYIPLTRKAAAGWNAALKYGRDYILRKWVKGITAMKIAEKERPNAEKRLYDGMVALVRKAVRGG